MMTALMMVTAYVAGSVNFSILLFRFLEKDDPRNRFSKNAGATNVYRQAGWFWALVVLLLDMGRAMLIAVLSMRLLEMPYVSWAGSALILGNRFPCFHGFKGGKGVANYLGFSIVTVPAFALAAVIGWALFFHVIRTPFVSSFAMVFILATGSVIEPPFSWISCFGTLCTLVLIYHGHWENIICLSRYERKEKYFGKAQRERSNTIDKGAVAVVIPLYNHEGRVRDVVRGAADSKLPVIVVDDGATDGSYDQIRDLSAIRIIRHPTNLGKGAALMTGFLEASKFARWVVTLDADGQHDPAQIPAMIEKLPLDGPVLRVGRRKNMQQEQTPWTSRFGRGFSNFWVRMSGGPPIADSQSGFRVYPLPETLDLNVKSRRFQFEIEVLVKAHWKGIAVDETPISVDYNPGGTSRVSHFHPFKDFMRNSGVFSRLIVQRIFIPKAFRAKM